MKPKFKIIKGDLTELKVDVIVNPSNKYLTCGSGLSGIIFKKAGIKELSEELNKIKKDGPFYNGLIPGLCVVSKAYNLPQKYIIHTLSPNNLEYKNLNIDVKNQGIKDILKQAHLNTLDEAEALNCETIAFPILGIGNFGIDIKISINVIQEIIDEYESNVLKKIYFVFYDENIYLIYNKQLKLT